MKAELFNSNLSFDGFTEVDGGYYVSSSTFNGLLFVSKESNTVEYIGSFEGEYPYKDTLHHKQYIYRDKIFFLPDHSKHIHIYDIKEKVFDRIPFGHIEGCEDPIRGVDSFRVQNYIWIFFAYAQNPVMKFNMDTCKIEEMYSIIRELPKEIATREIPVFYTPFCICEGKVYGAIWKSSYIFEFELSTASIKLINVKDDVMISGVAVTTEKDIYFTLVNNRTIGRYNISSKRINYLMPNCGYEITDKDLVYSGLVPFNKEVFLVSNITDDIYKISGNTVSPYLKFPLGYAHNDDKRSCWRKYYSWITERDKILMCPFGSNMGVEIDVKRGIIKGYGVSLRKHEKITIYKILEDELLRKKFCGIRKESKALSLEDYLKYIVIE